MVWFSCDACGDSIKKPKLNGHRCGGHTFTCVDCSMTFDRAGANGHTRCVTEHEKYALGATKPGGFAAGGFSGGGDNGGSGNNSNKDGSAAPSGLEFLSERPPWRCSACNVSCTSRETLLSHAAGQKHRRRARAAAVAAGAAEAPATPGCKAAAAEEETKEAEEEKEEEKKQEADGSSDSSSSSSSDSDSDDDKQKKKKRGRDEEQAGAVDKAVLAKVLEDARKKLAAKGKLKLDKLRALVAKRSGGGGKKEKNQSDRGGVGAIVDAAVAELQAGGEGGGGKRAKLSKDGQKLKVVAT